MEITMKAGSAPESTEKKPRRVISFVEKAMEASGYDVAKTTRINQEYYATATQQSGDAANSAGQRKILRDRARYEYRENSYFKAMNDGRAEDVIGSGPRIQINLGADDEAVSESTERTWAGWAKAVNLASKLTLCEKEMGPAGEVFGVLFSNPAVRHPIKLDIMLVEAERVATPSSKASNTDPLYVDGIQFDAMGNALTYDILNENPGSTNFRGDSNSEFTTFDAKFVFHWRDQERPSAHRSVPAITPALQLFGFQRRYTQSVVLASETAADVAYFLKSQGADVEDIVEPNPFESIAMEKGMALTMPLGWEPGQMKAEQPTNTYPAFKREMVVETGRSIRVPANVALGDSSGYNYASGRLDKQEYHKTIFCRQNQMGMVVLDKIFLVHWLPEAARIPGALTISPSQAAEVVRTGAWEWFWDGFEHVDPVKEANAQATRRENFMTTDKDEWQRQGKDWRKAYKQLAMEKKERDSLGLKMEDTAPTSNENVNQDQGDDDKEDEENGEA